MTLDSLCKGLAHDHFAYPDDVLVPAAHERVDLAQRGNGKPMLLLVELQLLQRDNIAGLLVPRAEDDAV